MLHHDTEVSATVTNGSLASRKYKQSKKRERKVWSVPDTNRYLPKGRDRSGISTSRMLLIASTNHEKLNRTKILYSRGNVRMMLGRQKVEATRELQAGRQASLTLDSLWNLKTASTL